MIFDTNLIVQHIRQQQQLSAQVIIPVVVAGELEAFALKADWGYQKVTFLRSLLNYYPIVEITQDWTGLYAQVDAYSQGRLTGQPLPERLSARNMGKNDIWIAATALYFDFELHTSDRDFDHLSAYGLRLVRYPISK